MISELILLQSAPDGSVRIGTLLSRGRPNRGHANRTHGNRIHIFGIVYELEVADYNGLCYVHVFWDNKGINGMWIELDKSARTTDPSVVEVLEY